MISKLHILGYLTSRHHYHHHGLPPCLTQLLPKGALPRPPTAARNPRLLPLRVPLCLHVRVQVIGAPGTLLIRALQ